MGLRGLPVSERAESGARWRMWEVLVPKKLLNAAFRPSLDDLLYDIHRDGPMKDIPDWRIHMRILRLVIDCAGLWFIGLFVQGGRPTWKAMAVMSAVVILFAFIVFGDAYAAYPAAEGLAQN